VPIPAPNISSSWLFKKKKIKKKNKKKKKKKRKKKKKEKRFVSHSKNISTQGFWKILSGHQILSVNYYIACSIGSANAQWCFLKM